jgi:hypothetical protein
MTWSEYDQGHFDAMLDVYQQQQEDAAWQAEQRSYTTALRPDAEPREVAFADLRPGDYMTNEGATGRWVKVLELRGPFCYAKSRQQKVADDEISVLFEIPEPVTVSGATRYWIERPAVEAVLIDGSVRRSP